jgi:CheY-like chemotaxis protein
LVLREQPTLLIADIVMPGAFDGIGLTRRVRQLLPARRSS